MKLHRFACRQLRRQGHEVQHRARRVVQQRGRRVEDRLQRPRADQSLEDVREPEEHQRVTGRVEVDEDRMERARIREPRQTPQRDDLVHGRRRLEETPQGRLAHDARRQRPHLHLLAHVVGERVFEHEVARVHAIADRGRLVADRRHVEDRLHGRAMPELDHEGSMTRSSARERVGRDDAGFAHAALAREELNAVAVGVEGHRARWS
ncbi:MAG: hypothetical protein R3B99_10520 [Polyangiales bacterium]